MKINDLPTPCLLLDAERFSRNCRRMHQRAHQHGLRLRPHLKTLKSIDAARQAMDASGAITVSTLHEAEYFAGHGIGDITLAVCLAPAKARRALAIHRSMQGPGLGVLVDSIEAALAIAAALGDEGGRALPVWLEIDCGEHRTGLDSESNQLLPLARLLAGTPAFELRGVLTHGGHSYRCRTVEEVQAVAETERRCVVRAAERLREAGIACPGVSAGSTPTAVHGRRWDGVTELRPGVYMAGDLFQARMSALDPDDLALSVLASVISSRSERFVIDAGGLALSKDRSLRGLPDDPGYGELLTPDGRPLGLHVGEVHQEHGDVTLPAGAATLAVGSRVRVLPNHACMTAAAYDRYHLHRGDEVVGVWPRINGWD